MIPDGNYYFQVTDPGGSLLLSTDPITEREVHISGGVFDAYLGSTHATGDSMFGGLTIGLFPFATTPNPGGVYKVWLTPVESYDPDDRNSTFGFTNNDSKTNNFRVEEEQTHTISGRKFNDLNGNGIQEAGEPGLAGWQILVRDENGILQTLVTDSTGSYSFSVTTDADTSHVFTIQEVLQDGWTQTFGTGGYLVPVDEDSSPTLTGFDF